MNHQKSPSQEVCELFKIHGIERLDLNYYAWPQSFGSTAGPRPGIGGQAITAFTVEAWVNYCGATIYTCAGMYSFEKEKFEALKGIRNWTRIPKFEV